MATAVQPAAPSAVSETTRLLAGSFVGAVFVVAAVLAAGYAVPTLWKDYVGPSLGTGFASVILRLVAQVAVAGGLIALGTSLAGSNPPKGLRGGIFLAVSVLIAAFFIARAVGLNMEPGSATVASLVVFAGLTAAGVRLLATPKAVRWMHALEEQGWFHTNNYKRAQGLRMRRYTIIGLLLIGLSGVWVLLHQATFGGGDLRLALPVADDAAKGGWKVVTVLTDIRYSGPLLIAAVVLWGAWRAVNVPDFADFLVATEAEMNKVSWSTRKRLIQDTVVVLITTALLTVFLLGVDLFWGWSLSQLGVLPHRDTAAQQRLSDPKKQKTEW